MTERLHVDERLDPICCDKPSLTSDWHLGRNADDEAVVLFDNLRCQACGRRYLFMDDDGHFVPGKLLEVYLGD